MSQSVNADAPLPATGLDAAALAGLDGVLAHHWGIAVTGPVQVLRLVPPARAVLRIPCGGGDVVVKIHVPPRPCTAREMALLEHLRRGDLRANLLEPLATKDGRLAVETEAATITVARHLQATTPPSTPGVWAQLGTLAAALHAVDTTALPPDSGSAFTFGPARAELIQDAPAGPWQDHYRKLLNDLPDLDAGRSALVHADLAPNNALLTPEGQLVLVDFDDFGIGPRVFDLGYPLLCWFYESGTFDRVSALAFYSAYAVRHRLDERERSAIVDAAVFYALMYDGGPHDTRRLRRASNAAGAGRPDLERLLSLAWAAGPARRMG